LRLADDFGSLLAKNGRTLVFGGGAIGLMGAVSKGCRRAGGRTVGVVTTRLRDAEQLDPDNSENIIVKTMRERKAILEAWGDALVVLPGGLGTMEEFFEVFTGRLLEEHAKPIILVDPPDPNHPEDRGFYAPLLSMIRHMIDADFAKAGVLRLLHVCRTAGEASAALDAIEESGPLHIHSLGPIHPYLPQEA
jgi:uncharacterized protein (TIGR00730 family)